MKTKRKENLDHEVPFFHMTDTLAIQYMFIINEPLRYQTKNIFVCLIRSHCKIIIYGR